jgi:hypothetical protein
MTKRDLMYQQIQKHGENLLKIFTTAKEQDAVKLSKKLFRLEHQAHQIATDYCNGENGVNSENWEEKSEPILQKVRALLNCTYTFPIFLNGDARGYALKIKDSYVRDAKLNIYRDMGGYGILAPDFN